MIWMKRWLFSRYKLEWIFELRNGIRGNIVNTMYYGLDSLSFAGAVFFSGNFLPLSMDILPLTKKAFTFS